MRIVGFMLLSYALVACTSVAERRAAHQATLDQARTLLELTQLVGVAPRSCLPLTAQSQLCTWEVNNRMPGYETLATIAHTNNVVFLVCDLPSDNRPRKEGSCQMKAVAD
jgi:hypothetical protein